MISKANSTFALLDTITKYAYEWRNVSRILKTYFSANDTAKKVESLKRVTKERKQFLLVKLF